jgi:hypothetical protein
MAYVGYPAGSAQAPQSGFPGGAMVPFGGPQLTAGLGAPGTPGGQDPRFFQELLNKLKGLGPAAGAAAKYGAAAAPGVANLAGGVAGGDVGQAVTGGAQIAAGAAATRAAAPVGAAVTRGAAAMLPGPAKLAAPLIGGATQALIGTGAAGLTGMAAQIPGAIAQGFTGQQQREREAGQTPGVFPGQGQGVGLSQLSGEQKQIAELARMMGVDIPAQQAAALMPYANQMKNSDMQRQMQLNQQLGQLTGALNRQQYAFQLAGGAQSQAGENLRTMMTSNPYAASTFRY